MDDLFGDKYQSLETSSGKSATKQLRNDFLSINDAPIQYVQRERIIPRQTYAQQQNVTGVNKNIVMTDPVTGIDSLFIGYEEDATSDG